MLLVFFSIVGVMGVYILVCMYISKKNETVMLVLLL